MHGSTPSATASSSVVVVTDLDGTLLDDDYDLAEAAACLDNFAAQGIPVIPASSKTLAEMVRFNSLRHSPSALIFENGAGTAWPNKTGITPIPLVERDYNIETNKRTYSALCALLSSIRKDQAYDFIGFADMSPNKISQLTGLTIQAASLAKLRRCSEPLAWHDSAANLTEFQTILHTHNLELVTGGRFVHVVPTGSNKSLAATTVMQHLFSDSSARNYLIACGDSDNDQMLLDSADVAVVFPNRSAGYLTSSAPLTLQAQRPGVVCWQETLTSLITAYRNANV